MPFSIFLRPDRHTDWWRVFERRLGGTFVLLGVVSIVVTARYLLARLEGHPDPFADPFTTGLGVLAGFSLVIIGVAFVVTHSPLPRGVFRVIGGGALAAAIGIAVVGIRAHATVAQELAAVWGFLVSSAGAILWSMARPQRMPPN